ncbi:MAG: hypothetical protein A2Y41_02000 [Spirochaetes bacterium GWB1_36_13]|nr:MAG: hypothetical protein A2Y41_02000 [Spirochaetes bacterium GWB1_36_13]
MKIHLNIKPFLLFILFVFSSCFRGEPVPDLRRDTTNPTLTITTASDQIVGNTTFPIQGTVTDNETIQTIEISIDGGAYTQVPYTDNGSGYWKYELDTSGLTNGTHTITVRVKDSNGNITESTINLTVNKDITIIAITPVTQASTRSTDFSATLSGDGITHYKYKIVDGASCNGIDWQFIEIKPIAENPVTLSSVAEGQHTLCALGKKGEDWQPGTSATSYSWTVDLTAPSIGTTSLPDNAVVGTGSFTFSGTVSDTNLTSLIEIKIDNGTYSPVATLDSNGNWTYTIDPSVLTEGTHTITIQTTDSLGNTTTVTKTFTVDRTLPTVTLTGTPSALTNQTTLGTGITVASAETYKYKLVAGTTCGDETGYSSETAIAVPITATGIASGQNTICAIGKNSLGNWQSNPSSYTWRIDTTAPSVFNITPNNGAIIGGTQITVSGKASDTISLSKVEVSMNDGAYQQASSSNQYADWYYNYSAPSDGNYSIKVKVTDAAGNTYTTADTRIVQTNNSIPQAIIDSGRPDNPSKVNSIDVSVGGNIIAYQYKLIAGSSCTGGTYGSETLVATHISESGIADGEKTLCIIGKNTAGTWQDEATSMTWTVDTTAPVSGDISVSGNPTGTVNSTAFNITVSGVEEYKYKLNSQAWSAVVSVSTPITNNTGINANGSNTLYIIGRDAAGNWMAEDTAMSKTVSWTVDTTAPSATDITLSGTPSSPTNQTTFSITVSGVVEYKYKLNTQAWSTAVSSSTPITNTTGIYTNAANNLYVIGKDAAGNWMDESNAKVFTWTIDTTPPSAPTKASSGTTVSSTNDTTPTWVWNAVSDAVLYRITFTDGSNWTETLSTSFTASTLNHGDVKTLFVQAKDAAGNWSSSLTHETITIDTVPPTASDITLSGTPAAGSLVNATTLNITVAGVSEYKYKLNGQAWSTAVSVSTPITNNTGIDANGSNTLYVIGKDAVGNWMNEDTAIAKTLTWTVDTTPLSAPAKASSGTTASPTTDTTPTWAWDSVSGAAQYRVSLDGTNWTEIGNVTSYTASPALASGSYTLYIQSQDAAGNWSSSLTHDTITVNATAYLTLTANASNSGYVKAYTGGSLPEIGTQYPSELAVGTGADSKYNRPIIDFDTSSIPDTATITRAYLKVTYGSAYLGNVGTMNIDIKTGYFGSAQSVAGEDWNAAATVSSTPSVPVATIDAFTSGSKFSTDFSSSGISAINKAGITQIRIKAVSDPMYNNYLVLSKTVELYIEYQ